MLLDTQTRAKPFIYFFFVLKKYNLVHKSKEDVETRKFFYIL